MMSVPKFRHDYRECFALPTPNLLQPHALAFHLLDLPRACTDVKMGQDLD